MRFRFRIGAESRTRTRIRTRMSDIGCRRRSAVGSAGDVSRVIWFSHPNLRVPVVPMPLGRNREPGAQDCNRPGGRREAPSVRAASFRGGIGDVGLPARVEEAASSVTLNLEEGSGRFGKDRKHGVVQSRVTPCSELHASILRVATQHCFRCRVARCSRWWERALGPRPGVVLPWKSEV